jgi:poly(3-hydroxybutyrate) depolymerase
MRWRCAVVAAVLWLGCFGGCAGGAASAGPAARTVTHLTFSYQGTGYPYLVFTPSAYDGKTALPALLLLHGAHGRGEDMLQLWQGFADAHGILLVAPTFPLTAEFEELTPKLLPELMDTVGRTWKLDTRRLYLFGYSAGGYSTFTAATRASTYFAAAAVFACIIAPDYDHIVDEAKRKTPMAIYIGDRDQAFSVKQTRRTRDLLLAHGFPVRYEEIANQDHNYAAASERVNADAWGFMSGYELPDAAAAR